MIMKITNFMLLNILILTTLIIMITMLNFKKYNWEKNSPYECGFNPSSKFRLPFSLHFFLISTLFLIFDIEISILIPMIISMKYNFFNQWFYSLMIILSTLILSIFYEWNKKLLTWIS
uniref:NADH-ubiquinone oxidoreductase chain 3 n=1 Tax=Mengenilla moldrzyki TaxID=1155016 RepID=J3S1W5_MENMO|nr:NADH dehydrogenase subunit 3 [Mengenilla moldrzyki]AFC35465.1 NADH dehydrogenase subunit 3 [Mengenilla moldrzyki]